jgi:hypothetical protein
MKEHKTAKRQGIDFDTMFEIADYIKSTPETNHSREFSDRDGFCPYTWKSTFESFQTGWPEGTEKAKAIQEQIEANIEGTETAQGLEWDVTGDFVDVGQFMEGVPEHFGVVTEIDRITETVEVVVNVSASCSVDQEVIVTRGAAIASLVDRLKTRFFVDLKIVWTVDYHNQYHCFTVNVDTKNLYSFDLLVFYLAHPGMLRRLCFSILERWHDEAYCPGYGHPCDYKAVKSNTIYFGKMYYNDPDYESPKAAAEKINQIIEDYSKGAE